MSRHVHKTYTYLIGRQTMKGFKRFAENMTDPIGLSVIPLALLTSAAAQMGEWHWTDSWHDWRGWVGFMCAFAGAGIVEATIRQVRVRLSRRARRAAP